MDKNEEKVDSEFLHALDFYMEENSLNKSELSKRTGIPYTTIDGWYKKGPNGIRLNTLRKLSDSLGKPISYWISEPQSKEGLGEEFAEMSYKFRKAGINKKKFVLQILDMPDELFDGLFAYFQSDVK